MGRRARAVAVLAAAAAAAACAQHDERFPAPWLKIDVVRPPGGTSGVIKLGAAEEDVYLRDSVGRGWVHVGKGHPVRYLMLQDGNTALVDLSRDGKGPRLARAGSTSFEPVHAVYGGEHLTVPPGAAAFDLYTCRSSRKGGGCADAAIERRDSSGAVVATFEMILGDAHPSCAFARMRGYDPQGTPYMIANCVGGADAKCLLVASRPGGLFVHTVGADRPWSDCSDFPKTGVSLREPERWTLLD